MAGGRIDVGMDDWSAPADVAVDFSTADALRASFPRYVERKLADLNARLKDLREENQQLELPRGSEFMGGTS